MEYRGVFDALADHRGLRARHFADGRLDPGFRNRQIGADEMGDSGHWARRAGMVARTAEITSPTS